MTKIRLLKKSKNSLQPYPEKRNCPLNNKKPIRGGDI
jgi:hypothetical protein